MRRVANRPLINQAATTGLRSVGARIPRLAAWGERRLPRVGIASVRMPSGVDLLLDGGSQPDWVTRRSFWHGLEHYEPEVLPVLAALARDATVIVDAGANIGVYTLVAARANPQARIFAFEPGTEVFAVLRRNVVINRAERAVCVRAALGETAGVAPVFTPAGKVDTVGSAQIEHRVTWTEGPWQCEYVPVLTLDELLASHSVSSLDILKIDVEGVEDLVLAGARASLVRHTPHVFCELLETPAGERAAAWLTENLVPRGYHAYVLTAIGPVHRTVVETGSDWNHLLTRHSPAELTACLRDPGKAAANYGRSTNTA